MTQISDLENEKYAYQVFKGHIEQLIVFLTNTIDCLEPVVNNLNEKFLVNSISVDKELTSITNQTMINDLSYLNNPILVHINDKINNINSLIVQKQKEEAQRRAAEEARRIAAEQEAQRKAAESAANAAKSSSNSTASAVSKSTGATYSQW